MDILSLLFQRKTLALLLFIIVSIVTAIVVVLYQKKPKIKEEQEEPYSDKIRKLLKNKSPEQKLTVLESVFKEFLVKKYNIHEKMDLYDLEKKFETNAEISNFCKLMIEAYYSGEKVTDNLTEKIKQHLDKIIGVENNEKEPEQKEKNNFGFFRTPQKKYYEKIEHIPAAPEPSRKKEEKHEHKKGEEHIRHGTDQQNNLSVFANKEHAANAKHNLRHAKHHLKNIHHSIAHSKNGTLNENLSISDWANNLGEIKSEIIDDCKKVLSKV